MEPRLIECLLVKMPEYSISQDSTAPKKFGRYLTTSYWDIKGYGRKRWVVGAYIDCDLGAHEDLSEQEIVEGCINFLNKPPPRKKYAKKDPKPKFGKLELYRSKIVDKQGKKYILALFIVEERKNRLFWGKGISV